MAGNRHRFIDSFHSSFLQSDNATQRAADVIINEPERHLLNQSELFWAEGGPAGLAIQLGAVGVGLAALCAYRPKYFVYLRNAQLRPTEWASLGLASFVSYRVGYNGGSMMFGDSQKVQNHWMAYFYVKQLNRYEGRQILTKAPKAY